MQEGGAVRGGGGGDQGARAHGADRLRDGQRPQGRGRRRRHLALTLRGAPLTRALTLSLTRTLALTRRHLPAADCGLPISPHISLYLPTPPYITAGDTFLQQTADEISKQARRRVQLVKERSDLEKIVEYVAAHNDTVRRKAVAYQEYLDAVRDQKVTARTLTLTRALTPTVALPLTLPR